jgi:hypothetical protein
LENLCAPYIVLEESWAWCHLGKASENALFLSSVELTVYGNDTALEECMDKFGCSDYVGCFRVVHPRAACTSAFVYMPIGHDEGFSPIVLF